MSKPSEYICILKRMTAADDYLRISKYFNILLQIIIESVKCQKIEQNAPHKFSILVLSDQQSKTFSNTFI